MSERKDREIGSKPSNDNTIARDVTREQTHPWRNRGPKKEDER